MTVLQAIILGIVQGITEFLPISSSGHLIIGETLLGLEVEELKDFDIVVHVGTLLAIFLYFWKDFFKPKYWGWMILGTIPAVAVGLTLEDQIDAIFRSALSVGMVMIVLGAIFNIPEDKANAWLKKTFKSLDQPDKKLTLTRVLLVGIAQSIAIIPGVSRSGSTIFTGTVLGMDREEAARFSFLLGSIAIAGAGLLTGLDLYEESQATAGTIEAAIQNIEYIESRLSGMSLVVGFMASFLAGIVSIKWLMKFLKKHSLKVFGIYLICIGSLTVIWSILS